MKKFDESRLVFVPFEEATTPPPDLIRHLKDQWWVVHPEKGVVFHLTANGRYRSPQCNSSEEIARRFLPAFPDWAEVRFFPSVFHKINPRDYA